MNFQMKPLSAVVATLVVVYSSFDCMASSLVSSDEKIRSLISVGARKVAYHGKVEGKTYFESEPVLIEAIEGQAELSSANQLCSMCVGKNKIDLVKLWGEPTLKSYPIEKTRLDKTERLARKWTLRASPTNFDKWFYLVGQSRVPVELSFDQQRCDSARISSKSDFEDAQLPMVRQISRGVDRTPDQVRKLLGEPNRIIERSGATNWVYSVDALFAVELIFSNGKCIGFKKIWEFDS